MEDENVEVEEVLTSMWPQDVNDYEGGSQFNVDSPREDHQDMLKEVAINTDQPFESDVDHLDKMSSQSEKGTCQLTYLLKHWEYKQANAVRLLREELHRLSKQRQEVELKRLEILEEHRFEEEPLGLDTHRHHVSDLEELYEFVKVVPKRKYVVAVENQRLEINAEYDTVIYWKERAMVLEKMLEESRQREAILLDKLEDSIKNMEKQSTPPLEELSQMLKRADNFIHFILQNAPIVLGHMDKDLRYRFIYNHYPSFKGEDIIGKTDMEIFSGAGVKESFDFKREVLERGLPGKREITFETELFGSKTFLIYVEPVVNKAGETIGVNYIGMDITDQVRKREKMAKLREEIAVQKAMETELNKTIHITEETMRAKQMLATMSHEIRSPLSGVVSVAEVLATTQLNNEQRQLLDVMISSGDLVLQLINDILDLSKVESGVMKLEATKFRPREVVKHVLQTAAASLKKNLTLEGHIEDNVPIEVVGDVLRIRQILTNLVSNAVKFTHEGEVGIRLSVVQAPYSGDGDHKPERSHCCLKQRTHSGQYVEEASYGVHKSSGEPLTPVQDGEPLSRDEERTPTTVWMCCEVYDTGIGIPEHALPALFKKYMQASADHARKYGGTGLGLAICKQLVEVMGGHMTVCSKENFGSTFTFVLPYSVSPISDGESDDSDELQDAATTAHDTTTYDDITAGYFQFQPGRLSSLFTSSRSSKSNYESLVNGGSDVDLGHVSPKYPCAYEGSQVPGLAMADEAGQMAKNESQPTCQIQVSDRSLHSCASSVPEVTRRPEEKQKILLVEDDNVNVMVTTSLMKQLGHSIDVVNNGVEAVGAVQSRSYDLILMDVCMPVMDGLEATRIIRSYEKTGNWDAAVEAGIEPPMHSTLNYPHSSSQRIPIIAMTANALSESAEECYANGMDSFVSKPVAMHNLKERLQQYLR